MSTPILVGLGLLLLAAAALVGAWVGKRRGRALGAQEVTSAAASKAHELELELQTVQAVAEHRVATRIDEVRAEARAALADDSAEAIDRLIAEARALRRELGL